MLQNLVPLAFEALASWELNAFSGELEPPIALGLAF